MKKLAILTTHPIQYYAPVFKLLHQRRKILLKVFYTWGSQCLNKYDPGFDKMIDWDLPLLDGYPYEWLKNNSTDPGSHHFKGIVNPELIEKVNAWQPDAVLVYGWAYQGHLKALRYFSNKIPVYFRGDSTLSDASGLFKQYIRSILLCWIYKHVDHVFYVGEQNRRYFKRYGLQDEQLTFAPHATDHSRFAENRQQDVIALRKELHIAKDAILITFAGKFEEKKDPLLLLAAFLQMEDRKAHLLFVGNGRLAQELRHKAQHHPRIHFLDFTNQQAMPVIYQASDLFCLPSKGPGETWGLAINEAMACSTAILASDQVGSAIDLVKNGYNGFIFKSQSLTSLTQHLSLLMKKGKKDLEQMGIHSENIIRDWTFQHQVNAIETAIMNYGH